MPLGDDLRAVVKDTFRSAWAERDGRVVPSTSDVRLANEAVHFEEATILYADLSSSTSLVDKHVWYFAAEIYKSFLYCAARIITSEGGAITAYDGDRFMGVFIGDSKNSDAARCALKINYAVNEIVNSELAAVYTDTTYRVRHVVGIDSSEVRLARTGVRGSNDLVWVGTAANYAAKLTSGSSPYASVILPRVYNRLNDSAKYGGKNNTCMWVKFRNDELNRELYGSNWTWAI